MAASSVRISVICALLSLGFAAHADSLKISNMPLAGDYGGRYGHTIVIDGKICRLGNSAGFSAPQGCNYEIRAGTGGDETLHATTSNGGCSMDCEPAPVRRGDMYAQHSPYFTTPRSAPACPRCCTAAPGRSRPRPVRPVSACSRKYVRSKRRTPRP